MCVPTEKVGCSYVTSQLKEFLNHFPPESRKKVFGQIYEILQVLDAYLIDNPQQHICCMSPNSEYVLLIMYATKIEIDLCNFPTIWAVLSMQNAFCPFSSTNYARWFFWFFCCLLVFLFLILSCPKCALVWGNCCERLRVEIFVRVLRSSRVNLIM